MTALLALLLALVAGIAQASAPTDVSVRAPSGGDGLTLEVSWKRPREAGSEPTSYALLRSDAGPEGPWTVVQAAVAASTTTFVDQVTDDVWTGPADRYWYRVVARTDDPNDELSVSNLLAMAASAAVEGIPRATFVKTSAAYIHLALLILAIAGLMMLFTRQAQAGHPIFIRRIPGIDAIEEGIGRATEMGRPVLYVPGIDELQDIQTIASMLILGQVSKTVAEYGSEIVVSCRIPVVREVADEVVKAGFFEAGFPDAHDPANVRFISSDQFAFTAGTNGIIHREKPATNLYLGRFFAESLILAETGYVNQSIQIAGTAEASQLPFFVAACDYTLIGEELFAVSAYLSRDPRLISSLKASDYIKIYVVVMLVIGTMAATFFNSDAIQLAFTVGGGG
ncbi:MAG: fibronectin type III domain-containing protein [Myxococcota bacterium]